MPKKITLLLAICLFAPIAGALADQPVVSFSAPHYTVQERGAYFADFTVVRTGDLTANVGI